MNSISLQTQYDKIYSYFKTTTEPFDELEWDGNVLSVWSDGLAVEVYRYRDLKALISTL